MLGGEKVALEELPPEPFSQAGVKLVTDAVILHVCTAVSTKLPAGTNHMQALGAKSQHLPEAGRWLAAYELHSTANDHPAQNCNVPFFVQSQTHLV